MRTTAHGNLDLDTASLPLTPSGITAEVGREPRSDGTGPSAEASSREFTLGTKELSDSELDEAALDRIRVICGQFSGVHEGELQDRPLFRVGRRRFAIFNGCVSPPRRRWSSSGRWLHFLAGPEEIVSLREDGRA